MSSKNSLVRVKFLFEYIFKGKNPEYTEQETSYIVLGQRNNSNQGFTLSNCKYVSKNFYDSRPEFEKLRFGDVFVNSLGGGTCGRVGFLDLNSELPYLSDGIPFILRNANIDKFLFYSLFVRQTQLEYLSVGATNQVSLKDSDLLNLEINYFFDKSYREKVAARLDSMLLNVNALIVNEEKQIEKLKQYKQSLISEVATKGLDPNVPMKDSGVEWIGKIPEGWGITAAKHIIFKLNREVLNDLMLICSNSGEVFERGNKSFGLYSFKDDGFQGVCVGDLLIHGMDTWHGAIAISNYDGKCTNVVHVCDTRMDKNYYKYYFQALAFRKVYKAITYGVRQNTSDFRSFAVFGKVPTVVPNINQQKTIGSFLLTQEGKIKQLILNKEKLIEKLLSYKQSIIYEYVTGKKEV